MKIILFIGHHKVGSTALQTYLAHNAIALLQKGILYPAVESQGLATLLSMAMRNKRPAHLPINLREAHNALAFRMIADQTNRPVPALHQGLPRTEDMLRTIQRQIEIFEPKVMILAAEVFANFAATSVDLIPLLLGAFPKAEIHLTATLRRIDDYLISWHSQRLRFGDKVRPLARGALEHYIPSIHFNYRRMLEGWLQALPGCTLDLRPYDAVMAAGGSVQDFMARARLPLLPDPVLRMRVNEGLHRGLFEIARQSNVELEPEVARQVFQLLQKISWTLDLPPSGDVEFYGAEARAKMAEHFAPVHDWLSKQVGHPFFKDLNQIATLRPHPDHKVSQAALTQLRDHRHLGQFPAEARRLFNTMEPTPHFN